MSAGGKMMTLPGFHVRAARRRASVLSFCALLMAGSARPAHSQGQMYIYPAKGQNQQQQDKDRYECHTWAVQQTGFDPSKAYPSNPNHYDPQPYNPSQPHVMRGAGRGAAMGAVGGAIGGNAGKGAAAGAAVGAMAGGFRRRDERRQQATAQQQQQAQASASVSAGYQRAMAACLQGRGYTVN
jgi:phage tail tape-measure protein